MDRLRPFSHLAGFSAIPSQIHILDRTHHCSFHAYRHHVRAVHWIRKYSEWVDWMGHRAWHFVSSHGCHFGVVLYYTPKTDIHHGLFPGNFRGIYQKTLDYSHLGSHLRGSDLSIRFHPYFRILSLHFFRNSYFQLTKCILQSIQQLVHCDFLGCSGSLGSLLLQRYVYLYILS